MTDHHEHPQPTDDREYRPARSMHDDVGEDEDAPCICAPEPRWQALADEMEREARENAPSDKMPDR